MEVIIWAAIFQGILLAILFCTSKQHSWVSNRLLGLFLFALVLEAILAFLPVDFLFSYPLNGYFALPEPKIVLPVLFLHYVLEKIDATSTYLRFLKINYVFFFLVVGITLVNVLLFLLSGKTIYDFFTPFLIDFVFLAQQTYAVILCVISLVIVIYELKRFKRMASQNYSDYEMIAIDWLWHFVLLLIPATLLWGAELIRIFIGLYTGVFTEWNFVTITWGVLILFIYYVSYRAFKHNDLLAGKNQVIVDEPKITSIKDDQSGVDELKAPLLNSMQESKLYLNSELTLYDVAKHIGASSKKVSFCINSNFQSNFSEWVNSFRVDEVKRRFEDGSASYLTIEAIGQEAGFKSRSAMYAAFKKFTGASPAKFREVELS